MDFIITLLIAFFVSILIFLRIKFTYWRNLGVPQFKIDFPFGHTKDLGKKVHFGQLTERFYHKAKEINAKFVGIYFFFRPSLIITDLELVKAILIKDFNIFPNRGFYFNEKDDPVSAHMFNLENEPWRILRQKLSPTFTSNKLRMMFPTIHEVCTRLISVIDGKLSDARCCVEIKDVLARFTTDVIGTTAFGIECNSLSDEKSKFYEIGTKIFTGPVPFYQRFLRNTFKDLARKLHIKSIPEEISSFYLSITKETVEYREKNDVNRHDFMNLLVQMKQNNIVTVEQIAAQSFIFFLAGYETSSSTMTYCMYELSVNLDIQDKARESVREILKKHNNEYTYDAVNEMTYLEQCVDETLRKYPVVTNLSRSSLKEYKIPNSNVTIPKNQQVLIPVYAIHHDPAFYPDPEKFNPDRFLPQEKEKRHSCAWLPFGEGNRICIGARFGKMETILGLAKILMNFKFTLDRSQTPVPLNFSPKAIVLTSEEKIFLEMKKI